MKTAPRDQSFILIVLGLIFPPILLWLFVRLEKEDAPQAVEGKTPLCKNSGKNSGKKSEATPSKQKPALRVKEMRHAA